MLSECEGDIVLKITPLDIRRQEFNRKVRGLDPEEVQTFLEMVADEFEAVIKENTTLKDRTGGLESQVASFREMEKTLQDTIVTAQKARDEAKSEANKEAEFIVRDAELKDERWIEEARQEVMYLKKELATLKGHKASFLAKMRTLLNSQSELLNVLELDQKELLQEKGSTSSGGEETKNELKTEKKSQSSVTESRGGDSTFGHEGEKSRPSDPGPATSIDEPDRRFSGGRDSEGESHGTSGKG